MLSSCVRAVPAALLLLMVGRVVMTWQQCSSMERHFVAVRIGMTAAQVQQVMGSPTWIGLAGVDVELRFGVFPVPAEYVIHLRHDRVAEMSLQTSA